MKVVIITNIPSPYRVYFFNELFKSIGNDFCVLYCAENESNRSWNIDSINHPHVFLKTRRIRNSVYWWSDIWHYLNKFNPDNIVTAGFSPVMLSGFLFALTHNKKHIVLTDSWGLTIKSLSFFHRLIRKIVFSRSKSFICISEKGRRYLQDFRCRKESIFISPLVIDTSLYDKVSSVDRQYDMMFSGQFVERKMPHFFADVVILMKAKYPNIKVLLIGDGPQLDSVLKRLEANNVLFHYAGFIQQKEIHTYYQSTKILLFPTLLDHWGVVANEACSAGTPVITCENAGVANELIIDSYNGYVLPLNAQAWFEKSYFLLDNSQLYESFSKNSLLQSQKFNIKKAIKGFMSAVE